MGAPPLPLAVAGEASGGGFELTAVVAPANSDSVSNGNEFELRGEIRQAPLRVYGGEYSLGVSAGIDTKVLSSCACLCWGMGVMFIDGFESGDTGEWSLAVP
jgi:hypothetical protein